MHLGVGFNIRLWVGMVLEERCLFSGDVWCHFDMTLNHLPVQTHSPRAAQGMLPVRSCLMKIKSPMSWLKAQPLQEVVSLCLLSTGGRGSFPAASTDTPCPSQSPHRSTTTGGLSRTCSLPTLTPPPGKCWGWHQGLCKQTALHFHFCTSKFPCVLGSPPRCREAVWCVFWGVYVVVLRFVC